MMQASIPPPAAPEPRDGVELRYRVEGVEISYRIDKFSEHWIIPDAPVPEAPWHDHCLDHLRARLVAWVTRVGRAAVVYRDIAIGVRRERPKLGFNPDVCIVEPPPPFASEIESLKLWDASHGPPRFAFEAVSRNHPYKDYVTVPEKCAIVGVQELVVFDPLLAGPHFGGGPFLLQVWRRTAQGRFERVDAGDGPTWCEYLDAYLIPDAANRKLDIAQQPTGEGRWPTQEEEALRRERSRADAALARAEAAEAELARIRDEIGRRRL